MGIYSFISFISGLLGLIVGVLCWLMVSLLFQSELRTMERWRHALMLFGPFAVLVPCIIRLADRDAMVGMIWMVCSVPCYQHDAELYGIRHLRVSALGPVERVQRYGLWDCWRTTTWVLIGLYLIKSGTGIQG